MELLGRVERHLKRSGTSPTRFGREAVRDPQFVRDLRAGRQLRAATERRVLAYLAAREQPQDPPGSDAAGDVARS